MREIGLPTTVGELRAMIANLPDDMPFHRRGNMGDHPPGVMLVIRELAAHESDLTYFADVKADPLWSKPKERAGFGKAVESLCVL